jgi:murein L,D-transpeptidase YafK
MAIRLFSAGFRLAAIGLAALTLAACQQESGARKDIRPVSAKLVDKMRDLGMKETSPILIRIFKEESALEVWKQRRDGQYALLKEYQICKWSGVLGPKIKEGDRQAPEGFYIVTPAQMNPKSSYYLSFNIGYPNAFDRSLGRTGTHLMVHGACSSAGCYSMTDEDAGELFALARDAFRGGQVSFQIQAFPFRMTAENFAKHRDDPNVAFWRNLKEGSDHFAVSRQVPRVEVCEKRYVFNADAGNANFSAAGKCPAFTVPPEIVTAVAAKQAEDDQKFVAEVAKLEADAKQAAAEKALAEKKAAEAAELAARPSPITKVARWISGKKPAEEDDGAATTASTPPIPKAAPTGKAPSAGAAPVKVASAPSPKKKPGKAAVEAPAAAPAEPAAPAEAAAVPTPSPFPDPAPAPAEAAAATEPFPTEADEPAAAPAPKAGTTVKREFDWPEDEPVMKGSAPIVSSGFGEGTAAN